MSGDASDVAAVVEHIRRYLRDHPNAADTVEGMAAWWLPGDARPEPASVVERAINVLLGRHELTRRTLSDGTVIYERTRDRMHGEPDHTTD